MFWNVFKYIFKATKEGKLVLCPCKPFVAEAYNAIFEFHHDSKSHSIALILAGGVIILHLQESRSVLTKKLLRVN